MFLIITTKIKFIFFIIIFFSFLFTYSYLFYYIFIILIFHLYLLEDCFPEFDAWKEKVFRLFLAELISKFHVLEFRLLSGILFIFMRVFYFWIVSDFSVLLVLTFITLLFFYSQTLLVIALSASNLCFLSKSPEREWYRLLCIQNFQ